jgi:hypothetical protein
MRRKNALHGAHGATAPPVFGSVAGDLKAKVKAFLIAASLVIAGLILTTLTQIAAFTPLGFIALGIYLARRVSMDLRAAFYFAMLAAYMAASAATDAGTAKQVRPMVKTANVGTVAASTGAVTAVPELLKRLIWEPLTEAADDKIKAVGR